VVALPEMLLPSANFAETETCVRRVISQKSTSLAQDFSCYSPINLLFHHCIATLNEIKKQKSFYNTPHAHGLLILHGLENASLGGYR
jgi:hypothetical protein